MPALYMCFISYEEFFQMMRVSLVLMIPLHKVTKHEANVTLLVYYKRKDLHTKYVQQEPLAQCDPCVNDALLSRGFNYTLYICC